MARETVIWVIASGWLVAILGGFLIWERYDATPGTVGDIAASDGRESAGWRLTVFAHPHCPCTRATLQQLAEIVHSSPLLSVRVVIVCPVSGPKGGEQGEVGLEARRIARAEVVCDPTGAVAKRAGAETSGHALLFDPAGQVVFRGGLTPVRGRTGKNAGQHAVQTWIGGGMGAAAAPVYGCPLFTPND
jgi:hypothetical protein